MSTREGAVFDLDYQRYVGARTGRGGIFWAIVWDGIRRAMGIGRRFRAKLLPWGVVLVAIGIALLSVTLDVLFAALDVELLSHSDYFNITSTLGYLFMATAAPEFLVPDRVHGVLDLYRSRPVSRATYLIARVLGLIIIVLFFSLVPQLILFIGKALASGNFVRGVRANLEVGWQVPATALVHLASQIAVAFPVAAFAKRRGTAAAMFIGTMLVTLPIAEGLRQVQRHFAHFAILQHPFYVQNRIFDLHLEEGLAPFEAGFKWWASLLVIVMLVLLATLLVWRRYRKLL